MDRINTHTHFAFFDMISQISTDNRVFKNRYLSMCTHRGREDKRGRERERVHTSLVASASV